LGTCVNVGCIPKKLYSYAAHYADAAHESHGFGWEGPEPTLNWATLKANRATEISRLNGVYGNLLRGSGVTVFDGFARIQGEHSVGLATINADGSPGHQNFSAKHILIATGGTPHVPHFVGREHVITSNEVFDLEPFPKRLLVVGGGYIACEFASIFNGLGAQVTQLYRGEQVLRGFDDEVRHFVAGEMKKSGVDLRLNADVVDIRQTPDGLRVELESGSVVLADAVLYATGRKPNVTGLGLDTVGVAQGAQGEVIVSETYQTNVPSIYAVGDVTNRVQLTPVALGEAMVVVDQLFGPAAGKPAREMSYDFIPTAVFTHPSIVTVGYSDAAARSSAHHGFPQRVQGAQAHAVGQQRAHSHEAGGGHRERPRGGSAHGGRRSRRDRAGLRRGHEGRRHQGGVRQHHRHPPDRGGRVRDHARTCEKLKKSPHSATARVVAPGWAATACQRAIQ
jgi:glutathione reductase (NADPH)